MSLHDLQVRTLDGETTTLGAYAGKTKLIVNVASFCGLTPQYSALQALHEARDDVVVLGFPCNQFGGQEPGSAEEIKTFCESAYGVTFPLFEKIEVNGPGRHPLYDRLTAVTDDSGYSGDIRWNFEKFVVCPDGERIVRFGPAVALDDPSLVGAIDDVSAPSYPASNAE